MVRKLIFVAACILLVAARAADQIALAPEQVASMAFHQGRYFEAARGFSAIALDADGKPRPGRDGAVQQLLQVQSMMTGEADLALIDRLPDGFHVDPSWAARAAAAQPRDAIAEIVRRARDTSIVILNEAHDSPRDRAFAFEVAKALRPLGYSLLAAETFTSSDAEEPHPNAMEMLAADRVVRQRSGYYTADPVFAAFARGALAIGYRPVAYEMTYSQLTRGRSPEVREQAQAENLMARIFAANPNAKVLIYVGYDHAMEQSEFAGGMMATRLKRMTGIDPLTIDQTKISNLVPSMRAIHAAIAARIGDRPSMLFEGGRPLLLGYRAGSMDLQVVHPATSYRDGRPIWLWKMGRRPLAIPSALLPVTGTRLIQVYAADAPADAVPIDQLMVTAGTPPHKLAVPPGPVRMAVQQ